MLECWLECWNNDDVKSEDVASAAVISEDVASAAVISEDVASAAVISEDVASAAVISSWCQFEEYFNNYTRVMITKKTLNMF